MRSERKKSMHRLAIDDAFDHQFFGIVSHEPDYKISLKLNELFNINLRVGEPAFKIDDNSVSFQRFTSISEYNDLAYQLVNNRSDTSILSKNFPALDYLFVICGSITEEIVEKTRNGIRDITEVTAVFILNKDQLTEEYQVLQNL